MGTKVNERKTIYCQFCDKRVLYTLDVSATMHRAYGDNFEIDGYGRVVCVECAKVIIEGHGPYLDKLDRTI